MPEPKRFRKKAVEVEAVQCFLGSSPVDFLRDDEEFRVGAVITTVVKGQVPVAHLRTGDWLLRKPDGHLESCKPDYFTATYEPAPASPQKDGGEGLAAELETLAEKYQRDRAKCKQDEKDDQASGKLGVVTRVETYQATWNYYEGLAKAYEEAARRVREAQSASPSEERSADDLLADLRPASRAHIALVAAVLQCIETGVEPDTIRRFVDEELPASPSPTIESRSDAPDDHPTPGRDRASAEHLSSRPGKPGTEGGAGVGADPASARSRASSPDGLAASPAASPSPVEGQGDRWPEGYAPFSPLSEAEITEAAEAGIADELNEVYMQSQDSAAVWAEATLILRSKLDSTQQSVPPAPVVGEAPGREGGK